MQYMTVHHLFHEDLTLPEYRGDHAVIGQPVLQLPHHKCLREQATGPPNVSNYLDSVLTEQFTFKPTERSTGPGAAQYVSGPV